MTNTDSAFLDMLARERINQPVPDLNGRIITPTLLSLYEKSAADSVGKNELFNDIESFVLFVGYARSGHSILGSILDAHRDMIVAHELDVLQFVKFGFSREQIFALILENSEAFARNGRGWSGRSYHVPDQYQGRFSKLKVIGDKKGHGTALALYRNPELLPRLQQIVGVSVKLIHVTRNPFDVISTMSKKAQSSAVREKDAIVFFQDCWTIAQLKERTDPSEFFELRHEDLVAQPERSIAAICHFLAVDCASDYLQAAASIVFQSPHKSRFDVEWCPEAIARVQSEMSKYEFLSQYGYDE